MKQFFSVLVWGVAVTAGVHAQEIKGTYAIQHVSTGKDLRPYKAGKADGNSLILYHHHSWKCLTWDFVHVSGAVYQLRNLYTSKVFEPAATPGKGVGLWQQPLSGNRHQYWEFISLPGNKYLIKLKGEELYITISSADTNSAIVLMPKQNTESQEWRLIAQDPWL